MNTVPGLETANIWVVRRNGGVHEGIVNEVLERIRTMNSQRSSKERFLKKSNGQNSNVIEDLNVPQTKKDTGFSNMYFIPASFSYMSH